MCLKHSLVPRLFPCKLGLHVVCSVKPGNVKFLCLFLFLCVFRPGSEVSVSNRVRGLGAEGEVLLETRG